MPVGSPRLKHRVLPTPSPSPAEFRRRAMTPLQRLIEILEPMVERAAREASFSCDSYHPGYEDGLKDALAVAEEIQEETRDE